jgi:hypothetical protein
VSGQEQIIEVEVVEIDGVAVEPRPAGEEARQPRGRIDWAVWQGRVKRLDARWWPLWLALGFVVLVAAVAVGLCLAVVFVAWRIFVAILRGFASLLSPQR